MQNTDINSLTRTISKFSPKYYIGRVNAVGTTTVEVIGLTERASVGDRLSLLRSGHPPLFGDVTTIERELVTMICDDPLIGVKIGDRVRLLPPLTLHPDASWLGKILNPNGVSLSQIDVFDGPVSYQLEASPPRAASRKPMGQRLCTGSCVFNTALPIVQGRRIGIFSGSGVGKTNLMGMLANSIEADVIVMALIGERGRELNEFINVTLGTERMKKTVIVAATPDMSAPMRVRSAQTALCAAEYFRDQGKHVVFFADSVTRFAEAYREIASAAGELPALRGYPASLVPKIMSLCERAGPGKVGSGDITAIFTVLVAGSDMDEPVADILRSVLDGHIVLDRAIADRGRYPAIDLLSSVSRALPKAATARENMLLRMFRQILGSYEQNVSMIQSGLYEAGSDAQIDDAIKVWHELDQFVSDQEAVSIEASFRKLEVILRKTSIYKSFNAAKLQEQ